MNDMLGKAAKHGAKHAIKQGFKQPPMAEKKNPFVAFIVGFLFGFLGYGIMTSDWKAAGWLFLGTVVLFVVIPGIGLFVAGIIIGGACAIRVHKSNEMGGHY